MVRVAVLAVGQGAPRSRDTHMSGPVGSRGVEQNHRTDLFWSSVVCEPDGSGKSEKWRGRVCEPEPAHVHYHSGALSLLLPASLLARAQRRPRARLLPRRHYYHPTAATLLLPHYSYHTTVATLLLPHYCYKTTAATLLLPHYYFHTTAATLLLPHYCCHLCEPPLVLGSEVCPELHLGVLPLGWVLSASAPGEDSVPGSGVVLLDSRVALRTSFCSSGLEGFSFVLAKLSGRECCVRRSAGRIDLRSESLFWGAVRSGAILCDLGADHLELNPNPNL